MELPIIETSQGEYTISTDPARLDFAMIHDFLANQSYWAKGIPEAVVRKSIENSLCFGVCRGEKQVGFARIISDYATYAYLADIFILEEERGRGLSKWLMRCVMDHPELQGLRRWSLATRDAHGLYAQYGFKPLSFPERIMEIFVPNIYLEKKP